MPAFFVYASLAPSATAVNDSTFGQIVGGQLNSHLIARQDANVVLAHFAGDVRGYGVTVRELHAERSVRKRVDDTSFHLNCILFRHALSMRLPGAGPEARELCIKVDPIAMKPQIVSSRPMRPSCIRACEESSTLRRSNDLQVAARDDSSSAPMSRRIVPRCMFSELANEVPARYQLCAQAEQVRRRHLTVDHVEVPAREFIA